jgi:hypothetical protein
MVDQLFLIFLSDKLLIEAVPDDVKVEILQQISSFLDKHVSQLEKNVK